MKKIIFLILILLLFFAVGSHARENEFSKLTGRYLGQKEPAMIAKIFAPGIVSNGLEKLRPEGTK